MIKAIKSQRRRQDDSRARRAADNPLKNATILKPMRHQQQFSQASQFATETGSSRFGDNKFVANRESAISSSLTTPKNITRVGFSMQVTNMGPKYRYQENDKAASKSSFAMMKGQGNVNGLK